ncbi:outer membrane protein assembly factor BamD [Belliella kenyensis]|uniref:Outer membrane protein assembly factor BamD n=1 Tax=Belliella kenyensis TaxID=1472724 RepID=A0ABV8EI77_9BACT|nr:outer membrane protein assembly factor BamD [Belliella kenyensis]MCH7402712.1 outer membrane protein assembly factor BamD [Belliella kenyensis]MDN3603740.1 outer membrane protein assembly factor BamD [Belliella kenyensis]
MKKSVIYIFTLSLLLAFSACGKFYKLEKSTNWEELYEAANKYYEKGEYNKAIILYDRVLPVIRGSERAELADFNYAYSHFRTKRYIEAAGYFNTFYQTYSRSPMAEEAMFMNAYSLYLDAPDYNLDQKSSKDAVNAIQLFINKFPQSDSYERAMGMIDDLQRRFEEKAYKESSMYLRLTEGLFPGDFYRACIINFQNFAKNYPDSKYNEELAFRLVDVAYSYAERSNFDKKEDRLNDALKFAEQFRRKYPESKYLSQVDALAIKTTREYDKFIVMKKDYEERLAKYKEEEAARAVSIEGEEVRTIPLTETNN